MSGLQLPPAVSDAIGHPTNGFEMKQFSCGDVVPGCTAQFHGEANDDILAQVAEHARVDHGMDSVPDEVVQRVHECIVEVAA